MITKCFEIRDSMTFIPIIATALASDKYEEAYLIGRAGYRNLYGPTTIMITRLVDCESGNCPDEWGQGSRTMNIAHDYIESHFHELKSGAVIDVQYILGETKEPKVSERLEIMP